MKFFAKFVFFFRVPKKNEKWRNEWVSAIKEANNDKSDSNIGVANVCSEHFLPECIQITKTTVKLVENSLPTEFWIDVIENEEDVHEIVAENFDETKENAAKTIEYLRKENQSQADEIFRLKNALESAEEKIKQLEETSDIKVRILIICNHL